MSVADDSGLLDTRELVEMRYLDIIRVQDQKMKRLEQLGIPLDESRWKRVIYAQEILMWGNCGGRDRPTISIPDDASLEDLEYALGIDPNADGVPDLVYWRQVQSSFNARTSGDRSR